MFLFTVLLFPCMSQYSRFQVYNSSETCTNISPKKCSETCILLQSLDSPLQFQMKSWFLCFWNSLRTTDWLMTYQFVINHRHYSNSCVIFYFFIGQIFSGQTNESVKYHPLSCEGNELRWSTNLNMLYLSEAIDAY